MTLDLLPKDPHARAESEDNIRGATGLMCIVLFAAVLAVPFMGNQWETWNVYRVVIPVWLLSVAGYINARRGYRYYSANIQEWGGTLALVGAATFLIHLAGTTATTGTSLYVLLIVFSTVFVGRKAGLAGTILSSAAYGLTIVIEQAGLVPFAPDMPAKRSLLAFPLYHRQTFFAVTILNGVAFGVSWYIATVLRRRRAEIEDANVRLRALDETKSRFLSVVSHDLRTPITSIKAYGELVHEKVSGEERQFMETIVREADRLNRLVTDLLDLDKMEAGKMDWTLTPQDVRPVVANAAHIFRAAARDKGVSLIEDIDAALPSVAADADRLAQLLANLLSNAIKFTPEGGAVTLAARVHARRASPVREELHIRVRDTGPGIAAADIDRIFDRFSQTETGKKEGAGTGLGLAIAKEITTAHGGELTVESACGEGTTFTVALPLAHRAPSTPVQHP